MVELDASIQMSYNYVFIWPGDHCGVRGEISRIPENSSCTAVKLNGLRVELIGTFVVPMNVVNRLKQDSKILALWSGRDEKQQMEVYGSVMAVH